MSINDVEALVDKYMDMLSIDPETRPTIEVRDNLGSKWLGRCNWTTARPRTTTIELQRAILADALTVERIIAHEMIHHAEAMSLTPAEVALIRLGSRPAEHGRRFQELADHVNTVMGPNFVTVTSDREYVQTKNEKRFHLLIVPITSSRLGWAWAAKLSPEAKVVVDEKVATENGKYVMTTDDRWTKGVRIKKFGGLSVPRGEDVDELRRLYESA
jgi:hypothetical protein